MPCFRWPQGTQVREILCRYRIIQVALGYFKDENETYWSYIYAASSISALVPILMFLLFQKYFVEGVTSSGIKG